MAYKSGFFNDVNGDRVYLAEDYAEYFASFIGNGVFPNPSNGCQIIASDGMKVVMKPGKAWIEGYYFVNYDDYNLSFDVADGVLKRIDRIVLRYTVLNRDIVPVVKKGVYASSPVAPTLQRDADAYEIALADVLINNGAISISQANITDQRLNTALCGIVHGTVDQVDTTTIFNQYESFFQTWSVEQKQIFEAWFLTIQDVLDENTAGNLLNIINAHKVDNTAHGIGNETLLTTAKTIKGAINEVFTNGNNVKRDTVGALLSVDEKLPLTNDSSWNKIISEIANIETGNPTVPITANGKDWYFPHVNDNENIIPNLPSYSLGKNFGETFFIYRTAGTESGYFYDINTSTFKIIPFPPSGSIYNCIVTKVGNKLYFFGGQSPSVNYSKQCLSYDLVTNTWQTLADSLYAFRGGNSFFYDGKIFYFHFSYVEFSSIVQRMFYYDIATNTHVEFTSGLGQLDNSEGYCNFIVVGNKFYGSQKTIFFSIDLSTKSFTNLSLLPSGLAGGTKFNDSVGMFYKDGKIYALGGNIPGSAATFNPIQIYDIAADRWAYTGATFTKGVTTMIDGVIKSGLGFTSSGSGANYVNQLYSFDTVTQTSTNKQVPKLDTQIVAYAVKGNVVHALNQYSFTPSKLLVYQF